MKHYELSDDCINNLTVFLNRVKYEGLTEIKAINDILNALSKPTECDIEKKD